MPNLDYPKNYENNRKEYIFRKVLEGRLALHNYFLTPLEPDIGHDMLLMDGQQTVAYLAQVKSSHKSVPLKGGRVWRYLTNIKAFRLADSFNKKYFYFFGLYQPDSEPPQFRMGCVPSSFFQRHWEFLQHKKLHKDGRVIIEIDYYLDTDRYYMFMKPLVDVTDYFRGFDAIG